MVSFISIKFAAVMLKFFQSFVYRHSIREMAFCEVFRPLLPQIWSDFVKILTRGSNTLANKKFETFLKGSILYRKGANPKFALLVQL